MARVDEQMTIEWIPGAALGVAGAALAWWRSSGISEAEFRARLNQIKEEMANHAKENIAERDDFKNEICSAINELRAVTLTMAKLSSGQDIINSVTSKTLDTLTTKSDDAQKQLNEISGTLSFMRQLFERMEKQGKI